MLVPTNKLRCLRLRPAFILRLTHEPAPPYINSLSGPLLLHTKHVNVVAGDAVRPRLSLTEKPAGSNATGAGIVVDNGTGQAIQAYLVWG